MFVVKKSGVFCLASIFNCSSKTKILLAKSPEAVQSC